jgi:hypothetical protein
MAEIVDAQNGLKEGSILGKRFLQLVLIMQKRR